MDERACEVSKISLTMLLPVEVVFALLGKKLTRESIKWMSSHHVYAWVGIWSSSKGNELLFCFLSLLSTSVIIKPTSTEYVVSQTVMLD
jgi:hypothetical protein